MEKELIEEKIERLFFESRLEEWLIEILLDDYVESREDFFDEIEWKLDNDFEDDLKWLILKSYVSIPDLQKVNFEEIEKEFFEDLKKCFDDGDDENVELWRIEASF